MVVNQKSLIVFVVKLQPNCNDRNLFNSARAHLYEVVKMTSEWAQHKVSHKHIHCILCSIGGAEISRIVSIVAVAAENDDYCDDDD